MLQSQYRFVLQVPYYEFENTIGKEAEYLRDKLKKVGFSKHIQRSRRDFGFAAAYFH